MKRAIFIVTLTWLMVGASPSGIAQNTPTFDIRRPTIVAFFPPVTQSELSKDIDTATAMDDFQFYAAKVRQPLEEIGVDFKDVYAHSFRVCLGKSVTTFRPTKVNDGYYLV
jgi:hypothetical protein